MTNYEHIKNMSVEEMADYFYNSSYDPCEIASRSIMECDNNCRNCIKKMLESEAKTK